MNSGKFNHMESIMNISKLNYIKSKIFNYPEDFKLNNIIKIVKLLLKQEILNQKNNYIYERILTCIKTEFKCEQDYNDDYCFLHNIHSIFDINMKTYQIKGEIILNILNSLIDQYCNETSSIKHRYIFRIEKLKEMIKTNLIADRYILKCTVLDTTGCKNLDLSEVVLSHKIILLNNSSDLKLTITSNIPTTSLIINNYITDFDYGIFKKMNLKEYIVSDNINISEILNENK